jgi:hypothetical protein
MIQKKRQVEYEIALVAEPIDLVRGRNCRKLYGTLQSRESQRFHSQTWDCPEETE